MEKFKIIVLDTNGNEAEKTIKVNEQTTEKQVGRTVIDLINELQKLI